MQLNLTELSYDATWFDFNGARLKIRPFPFSKGNVILKNGAMLIDGEEQARVFKHSLVDWENVVDGSGKPIPCTDEIKQKIYDFRVAGIADFVLQKCQEFETGKAVQEKNS